MRVEGFRVIFLEVCMMKMMRLGRDFRVFFFFVVRVFVKKKEMGFFF